MAKKIINKCPNCGTWSEAEEKNLFGRFISSAQDTAESASKIGNKLFSKVGLGKVGEEVVGDVGAIVGIGRGMKDFVDGDNYRFVCPRCGNKWSVYDDEKKDICQYEIYVEAKEMAEHFGEVCQKGPKELESFAHQVQLKLNDERNFELSKLYLYNLLAATYHELNNRDKALSFAKEALSIVPDKSISQAIKGYVMGVGRNSSDALAALTSLIKYKDFSTDDQIGLFTEEQYHDRFLEIQNRYITDFLSMPVDQRRFVYLIDGNIDGKLKFIPETIRLLPKSDLPTEIKIIGVPQENVLYICHPYKPDCYIPANEYQLELLRDELHEFCHIMDYLGAKRISLSDSHTNQQGESREDSIDVKGGGSYNGYSGSAHVGNQSSSSLDTMIHREFSEQRDFQCSKDMPPCIPADIVWYHHRQEWQLKVISRLEGRLIKDKFTIATSQSETVYGSKKLTVEAEVNAVATSLNATFDKSSNFTIKQSESYYQEVEVEFWPLGDYSITPKQITPSTTPLIDQPQPKPRSKRGTILILAAVIVVVIIIGVVLL
jgi:tetratricopeptide (TPR) repeat protein